MNIASTKPILLMSLIILVISGCGEITNDNSNVSATANQFEQNKKNNANISKDDIEELGKIIKLPMQPEEASWREDISENQENDNGAPTSPRKKLTVVLKYSAEDAQKIVEQSDKSKPAFASDIDAESWFPPELVAKSQESGDENLKGTSYAANDFLQEPYKNGKLTRINDTDFFVLELTSY